MNYWDAQERAEELGRLIKSISTTAMLDVAVAKDAAQKRKPRGFSGKLKKVESQMRKLAKEAKALRTTKIESEQ